ncbi:MAG: hypothetical protein ABJF01_14200 [bacterium]
MQREAILRRLLLVKYLLRRGSEEALRPEPLCASAILLLHDAIELILGLGTEHHNVGTKQLQFMQYIDHLDAAIAPNKLAHRESVRRLNDARVSLKHHGVTPARRDIAAFEVVAQQFIRDNLPLLFGASIDDVTLADLVQSERVRACLRRADAARLMNDTRSAAEAIAEAFTELLLENRIPTNDASGLGFDVRQLEDQLRSVQAGTRTLSKLVGVIDALHEEVALIRQGIDTRKLAAFRAAMPAVNVSSGGIAGVTWRHENVPSDYIVQFCYDFVIDSTLSFEESRSAISEIAGERATRSRFGVA